jgi:hypothetical protein
MAVGQRQRLSYVPGRSVADMHTPASAAPSSLVATGRRPELPRPRTARLRCIY